MRSRGRIAATLVYLPVLLLPALAAAQGRPATGPTSLPGMAYPPIIPEAGPVNVLAFRVQAGDPLLRCVGRFDRRDPNCYRFSWSGCTVQFRFRGQFASVLLEDTAPGGPHRVRGSNNNYFEVIVNSREPQVFSLRKGLAAYAVVNDPNGGEQIVTIFRRTEPLFGEVRFHGIELDASAKLLPPPPPPKRLIEFIGDSITAGYGNEANDAKDGFCPATQNNYLAYGAVTARNLSADYVCLAWSGQGVLRDRQAETDKVLPVLYNRTLPNDPNSTWDFKGYKADAVVINLCTNDFAGTAPPKNDFLKAYSGLIETVLKHHAGAHVFCCVGPMMQDDFPKDSPGLPTVRAWLTEMVADYAKAGRRNIHYVEFDRRRAGDGVGSSYHPSVRTHQAMAEKLTEAIRKEMGW